VRELDEALAEALRPMIQEMVKREVRQAGLEWSWKSAVQAAEILGVKPATVYRRFERGQLPGRKVRGRLYIDMRAFGDELAGRVSSKHQLRGRAP